MPVDPLTELAQGAAQLHEVYLSYVNAGFTEAQALRLTVPHPHRLGGPAAVNVLRRARLGAHVAALRHRLDEDLRLHNRLPNGPGKLRVARLITARTDQLVQAERKLFGLPPDEAAS